ncbi:hypothetical protein BHE74_00019599 [Ensete ventricosum]|nr:hypothetical protein BHE74_00019599 [Ensete ventricosum]
MAFRVCVCTLMLGLGLPCPPLSAGDRCGRPRLVDPCRPCSGSRFPHGDRRTGDHGEGHRSSSFADEFWQGSASLESGREEQRRREMWWLLVSEKRSTESTLSGLLRPLWLTKEKERHCGEHKKKRFGLSICFRENSAKKRVCGLGEGDTDMA